MRINCSVGSSPCSHLNLLCTIRGGGLCLCHVCCCGSGGGRVQPACCRCRLLLLATGCSGMQRFQSDPSKAGAGRKGGRAWRDAAVSKQAGPGQELPSRCTLHTWMRATDWLRSSAHLHCSGGSKPDSHAPVFEREKRRSAMLWRWNVSP